MWLKNSWIQVLANFEMNSSNALSMPDDWEVSVDSKWLVRAAESSSLCSAPLWTSFQFLVQAPYHTFENLPVTCKNGNNPSREVHVSFVSAFESLELQDQRQQPRTIGCRYMQTTYTWGAVNLALITY